MAESEKSGQKSRKWPKIGEGVGNRKKFISPILFKTKNKGELGKFRTLCDHFPTSQSDLKLHLAKNGYKSAKIWHKGGEFEKIFNTDPT